MAHGHPWWDQRKDELIALAEERSPCLVYNEETLNDILFDLLFIEGVERVFYPVRANPHPVILEKAYSMGAGFACLSSLEMDTLLGLFPDLSPDRFLLVPDTQRAETLDQAFHSGVSVVLKSLDAFWAWEDFLKGRDILVWVSSRDAHKGEDDARERSEAGVPLWDMDAFIERAGALKSAVVGLYATLDWARNNPEKWFSHCDGIWNRLDKAAVFVLAGLSAGRDPGGIDTAATAATAEALQDRYPEAAIWLDPGSAILSQAGGLLIKGRKIVGQKEGAFIETYSGERVVISRPGKGPSHDVVNLSRLEDRVEGKGDTRDVLLIITNMGAAEMYSTAKTGLRVAVSEHYLRARSICQVKI